MLSKNAIYDMNMICIDKEIELILI